MAGLVVVTSIAPRNLGLQRVAVDSWLKIGFKVVSINSLEEINLLSSEFKNILFVPALRSALEHTGKPYVYFDDVLKVAKEICTGGVFGIINSDIILDVNYGFVEFIQKQAKGGVVFGSRTEIANPGERKGEMYIEGFDVFFMDPAIISFYPPSIFCLGVPWWDYWAPLVPILHNFPVKRLVTPGAYHVSHPVSWDINRHSDYGSELIRNLKLPILSERVCGQLVEIIDEAITKTDFALLSLEVCRYIREHAELLCYSEASDQKDIELQSDSLKRKSVGLPFLPKISIVTPSFNQAEYLEECIDSVLSQNYPKLEYIVMDGGSTDGSVDIIKKYEKHLTYWQSQPDGGQYNAVNDGFKRTSGEIMAWLNSDDKYHRDALFKVAYLFESSPSVEWLTGYSTFWGKTGEIVHVEQGLPTYCRKDFLSGRYNKPFIQQESTFWKRSLWERAGGSLRTDLEYAGDLELWVRFFRHALLYSADVFLGGYRSHGNQKAALFMDRYVAEAEAVIEAEKALHGEQYVQMSPDAPTPLVMDISEYRKYLLGKDLAEVSTTLMVATEDALQYFLNGAGSSPACAEERQRLLVAYESAMRHANNLESSLSWRVTKPLRWLGNLVRKR